jgi:hypothetical protein
VNDDLQNSNQNKNEPSLDQRFATRPHLRRRLLLIADMIDQAVAEGCTVHQAEARALEQIRKLGQEILTDWAGKSEPEMRKRAQAENPKLINYGKKKTLSWHSTYGIISVREQCLRLGRRGEQIRPFCQGAQIRPRGYSQSLQKALVDFGADDSFLEATKKIREHYGVEVPLAAARQQTLKHAKAIGAAKHRPAPAATIVLTGLDGSMVPIVESGTGEDQRQGKTLLWKQANLCCARAKDAVECVYGATMASVKMAGLLWREVAVQAGLVGSSRVHAVADGAEVIFHTFIEQFGGWEDKAKFTVDYYHVDEHLSPIADLIAPTTKAEWLQEQHERLFQNKVSDILQMLEDYFEATEEEPAPIRSVHQYLHKRKDNLDYAGARAEGLPIGSGELESGHRHVIQQRLKIAGAWWKVQNAEAMLQLRTVRANNDWDQYWTQIVNN